MMNKSDVAEALEELSRYLEMKGENKFKVGAYARAADAIESTDEDLEALVEHDQLTKIDGIGKGTASVIRELVLEGQSSYLEELRSEFPASLMELAAISGVGPKRALQLYAELGIETVDDLEAAIETQRLGTASGFGAKTVERARKGIETWRKSRSRVLLPMALEAASLVRERIESVRSVSRVEIAGEVRRRAETVGSLDFVAAASDPAAAIDDILAAELPGRFSKGSGGVITGTIRPSLETRITVVDKKDLITRLLWETGSEGFIDRVRARAEDRDIDLEPDSVRVGNRVRRPKDESALFRLLDLPDIPPELRETGDAIDEGVDLDRLVEIGDLRGTFHVHTTWSDGKNSLDEMVGAAEEMGFEYVGISDHSKTASYAGGLTEERVARQHAEIRKIQRTRSIRIFRGTECDILPDGTMDFDSETLSTFDFVIASVHSRFSMPPDEMSDRMVRALANPWVTFLGHVSGRKLLIRDGYSVEYDRVFDAAASNGVLIEINGNPRRLDLDWKLMRRAIDRGVRFSINPDAHSTAALEHVTTGVWNARRGFVPREAVLNTGSVEEVEAHLKERRRRAKKMTKE